MPGTSRFWTICPPNDDPYPIPKLLVRCTWRQGRNQQNNAPIDVLDVKRLSCDRSLDQKARACGQQSVRRVVRSDRHLGQMSTEARLSSAKASQADAAAVGNTRS